MFWQTAYMQPPQANAVPYNHHLPRQPLPSTRTPYNPHGYNPWQQAHNFNQYRPTMQQNRHQSYYPTPHVNFNNHMDHSSHYRYSSNSSSPQTSNKDNNRRCSPCDREFNSVAALQAHKKMHVKCEHEGCSFVASSKAVKLHFIQTHAEGRFRICLQTPQEIAKWREERKRNWPSVENMARKKQKQLNDERDGIVIETKEFSYGDTKGGRGHGQRSGNIRERGRGRNRRHSKSKHPVTAIKLQSNYSTTAMEGSVKPTTELKERVTMETDANNKQDSDKVAPTSGLGLLLSYEDEVTDEREELVNKDDDELQISSNVYDETIASTGDKEEGEIRSDCELDSKTFKKECTPTSADHNNNSIETREPVIEDGEKTSAVSGRKRRNRVNKKQTKKQNEASKNSRKVSLLEMKCTPSQRFFNKYAHWLLANEIRHERNVLLQCIRYIVKENFFDT